jgi:hypothetical protein
VKYHKQRTPQCIDYTMAIRRQVKVMCSQRQGKILPATNLKMFVKWEQLGQDGLQQRTGLPTE